MISVIALDDEPPALEVIKAFCERMGTIELQKTFTRTNEALQHIKKFSPDLILLDINMPSVNGIDFYRSLSQPPMAIFTTSYTEFAIESYDLQALDYLVKPYTYKRFHQAMLKAQEMHRLKHIAQSVGQEFLVVKEDYGQVKIPLADILFIEGLDNYLKIHLKNNKSSVIRMTMKALLEKLPYPAFIRVHRSFIVPLSQVLTVRNKIITLHCEEEIPIGSSYEEAFFSVFGK